MPARPKQIAKRELVKLINSLAQKYGASVYTTRESDERAVKVAYRRLVRHVHPDRGGNTADAQALHSLMDEWQGKVTSTESNPGSPSEPDDSGTPEGQSGPSQSGVPSSTLGSLVVSAPAVPEDKKDGEKRKKKRKEKREQESDVWKGD
jgi:hypothetical protein